jgi:hypothetical protein
MKRTSAVFFLGLVMLAARPEHAAAVSIVDLVGDKDGFGLPGAPAVPADGTRWATDLGGTFFTDYRDAGDLANAPFTDIWAGPDTFSYAHNYALGGLVPTSATLAVQIAGIHDINLGTIYDVVLDGTVIGQIPPNPTANGFQEVKLYNFNVPLGLITGNDSVSVSMTGGDGYSINFSELTIEAVPEPSSAIVIAIACFALLACRCRLFHAC